VEHRRHADRERKARVRREIDLGRVDAELGGRCRIRLWRRFSWDRERESGNQETDYETETKGASYQTSHTASRE
jgi:hypothetical protein